mmetsp:Transcript_41777/g.97917  ORF Transcript_41777/g.97917 Transcript_41777/m.97917 type:complete len:80 (+) Transcript_41777:867-1106(+)
MLDSLLPLQAHKSWCVCRAQSTQREVQLGPSQWRSVSHARQALNRLWTEGHAHAAKWDLKQLEAKEVVAGRVLLASLLK